MNEEIVINRFLNELNRKQEVHIPYDSIASELNVTIDFALYCLKEAYDLGLTEILYPGNYSYVKLSPLGKEIQNAGGWIKHLEKKNKPKSKFDKFYKFTDHKVVSFFIIALILLILSYFGIKNLK